MAKAALICIGLALAALAGASRASGAPPPPPVPPDPAIAQYVEVVPTSAGPAVPTGRGPTSLPSDLTRRAVVEVASSPRYGAPTNRLHANARVAADERRAAEKPAGALSASTFGAAVDAVGAGHGVVLWLGLALLVTTAAGVGAAIRRARR